MPPVSSSSSTVPVYRASLAAKPRRKPNLWLQLSPEDGVMGASDDLSNSRLNRNSTDAELISIFENWEDTPVPKSSITLEEGDIQVLLMSPESSSCNPEGTLLTFGLSVAQLDFDCDAEGMALVSALPSPVLELEGWEEEDEEYHGCEVLDQHFEELTPTKTRSDSKLYIDTSFVSESSLNSFSSIEHGFTLSALFLSPDDSSAFSVQLLS